MRAPRRLCLRLARRAVFWVAWATGLTLAACATRPTLHGVGVEVVPMAGFRLKAPWVSTAPEGVKFRGWICRASPLGHMSPQRLRVERLAPDGSIETAVTGRVTPVPPRAGCSLYDVASAWRADEVSSIRVCRDAGKPCPVPNTKRIESP